MVVRRNRGRFEIVPALPGFGRRLFAGPLRLRVGVNAARPLSGGSRASGIPQSVGTGFWRGGFAIPAGPGVFESPPTGPGGISFSGSAELGWEDGLLEQNLARSLISRGRYPEAIEALKRAAKMEPLDWRIESLLGNCYQKLNQTQAALSHWEKALGQLPTSSLEYHRLRQKVRIETWRNQSPLRPKRPVRRPPSARPSRR